jgi:integrase
MGLYKRCEHFGRQRPAKGSGEPTRERCACPWWGSFKHDGKLRRESLGKWANEEIKSKEQAKAIYERFRQAVREGRAGRVAKDAGGPMTFDRFVDVYVDGYVTPNNLTSADTIDYRMGPIRAYFGAKLLADIRTADIEDFVTSLKAPAVLSNNQKTARVRKPATINRYVSLLRHMFGWAEGRQYIDRDPFRRGNTALVKQLHEDNRRDRRITPDEEQRLLSHAAPLLKLLIIVAVDTGARRGEMLALTWADVDARPGWLRLRGVTTKAGKTRFVPIATSRLQSVLDYLRVDAAGEQKTPDTLVLSNEAGEPIRYVETAWRGAVLRAHGVPVKRAGEKGARRSGRLTTDTLEAFKRIDLRWHDLRGEYASRLVERGVPLSQVRDLLGHASIITTERYDRQTPDALMASAKRLETGERFTFVSQSQPASAETRDDDAPDSEGNDLPDDDLGGGVDDGTRTRNVRSHSPVLYL